MTFLAGHPVLYGAKKDSEKRRDYSVFILCSEIIYINSGGSSKLSLMLN
jgi:hypothetical protein